MSKEEAIKELQESLDTLREYDIAHSSRLKQALEMAIKALSQEPCDDAISREAVIERLKKENKILYTPTGLDYLIRAIEDLPSVTQKSETWNGYHGQVTAPKGTFKKIWEEAESEDKA